MRYATVGTGWITDAFIEGAALAGGLELAAVYSRQEDTGRAFASKHGGAAVYTDLALLAQCPEIDAVYIASPNALHEEQSRLFLQHGKHVLCEKPVAVTSRAYRELQALAQEKGLVYMEAIMMRHLPARQVLHEAVASIGQVCLARFDFAQLSSKYPRLLAGELPNIFNPRLATGCLMDLGVYCVYAALDLFGPPRQIEAHAAFLPTGADNSGGAILTYPGLQAVLSYAKTGQGRAGSEIIGDKGTLVIESISKLTGMRLLWNDGREEALVGDLPKAELMRGEAAAFHRYVTEPAAAADYAAASELAGQVCDTLEKIRLKAGIRFDR